MITAGRVADLVVDGEESVALVGKTCLRLGPIATAIMQLLPCSRAELRSAIQHRFGDPTDDDLDHAIERQLQAMAEVGLINLRS